MKNLTTGLAVLLGILFVVASSVYFMLPAHSLPHFFPGYSAAIARHHYTHGVASLLLGLACFAYAWFATGKKKSSS